MSMLDAFVTGDRNITDMPAFNEFKKYVGEIFENVKCDTKRTNYKLVSTPQSPPTLHLSVNQH